MVDGGRTRITQLERLVSYSDLDDDHMVSVTRFELATPPLQMEYSTRLSYTLCQLLIG